MFSCAKARVMMCVRLGAPGSEVQASAWSAWVRCVMYHISRARFHSASHETEFLPTARYRKPVKVLVTSFTTTKSTLPFSSDFDQVLVTSLRELDHEG